MKNLSFFISAVMLVAFSFCREKDSVAINDSVNGSEATIAWQECAFFTDHDVRVCFVDANEYRCPCNTECFWEGALDVTLHVTTTSGIDTTVVLTTNSNPIEIPNAANIGGKIIRFANTTIMDCADYGNYEKYKVVIEVE